MITNASIALYPRGAAAHRKRSESLRRTYYAPISVTLACSVACGLLVLVAEPLRAASGQLAALCFVPLLAIAWAGLAKRTSGAANGVHRAHDLLIIGKNRRTRDYLAALDRYENAAVKVVGVLDPEIRADSVEHQRARVECESLLRTFGIPELGNHRNLARVICENAVDEVLITLPIKSFYEDVGGCMRLCHEAGVPVSLSTDLFGLEDNSPGVLRWGTDIYRLNYARARHPRWRLALKRAIDLAGATIALAIFALPMLLTALAVKLSSRGPILFTQERVGLNHKRFRMLKFRTMLRDAEQLRRELEHLNEQSGPVFKMAKDPRVTPLGRFLRKYSLDELPQLFNVLAGDMSLVGPRPPIPREVDEYQWWQRRRLSMRPGLTCLWQVSGRQRVRFDEWMKLDLQYIDAWSLSLDLKLLVRTIPELLKGSGI